MMLLKIAWNNVWRHKIRSLVVITAIALGLIAGIFASAFVNGMMVQKVDSVVKIEMSHFQLHHPKFRDDQLPELYIKNGENILNDINHDIRVKSTSGRVISNAMFASATFSGAIKVIGISPTQEAKTTGLENRLIDGQYFEGIKTNPILISKTTAEKYKIKLRSKVVLTMQDITGEIVSGAFRVVGIFDSKNTIYDKMNVFVKKEDIRKLLKIENSGLHEIAVLINNQDLTEPMVAEYKSTYKELEVLPWLDLSMGMRFIVEAMDTYTVVLVGIILLALLFSIINTMLMAVLERIREIGMLMAIGMSKPKVFVMILIETIFLSLVGGPIGLLLSWMLIDYFGKAGINLAGAAYEDYGFSTVIYPYLEFSSYMDVTLMVIMMSVVASIYPARKALKLNPAEAIRKI